MIQIGLFPTQTLIVRLLIEQFRVKIGLTSRSSLLGEDPSVGSLARYGRIAVPLRLVKKTRSALRFGLDMYEHDLYCHLLCLRLLNRFEKSGVTAFSIFGTNYITAMLEVMVVRRPLVIDSIYDRTGGFTFANHRVRALDCASGHKLILPIVIASSLQTLDFYEFLIERGVSPRRIVVLIHTI